MGGDGGGMTKAKGIRVAGIYSLYDIPITAAQGAEAQRMPILSYLEIA